MERKTQFIAKFKNDKWMLWLQIDDTKALLIDTLNSQEEVTNYIENLTKKTVILTE